MKVWYNPAVEIVTLHRAPYEELWEQQRSVQRALIGGGTREVLFLCEHPPTITIGRSGTHTNVLASTDELTRRGVTVYEVERGGDVTFHGPGQIVAYPIINLSWRRRDVGWYMRTLEEAVLRTLQAFGITGLRIPGRTGVWTQPPVSARDPHDPEGAHKIASIGVRLSRWCTLHGLSLNVRDCSAGFSLIHPCGFTDIAVTSIEQQLERQLSPEDEHRAWKLLRDHLVDLLDPSSARTEEQLPGARSESLQSEGHRSRQGAARG